MINNKLLTIWLLAFMITGVLAGGVHNANAQTNDDDFPEGCGSALGYSYTTGAPCNGKSTPTARYLPGCVSALGYSATNGAPCSGGDTALTMLAGCTSLSGYSAISGEPCNGTDLAQNSGTGGPSGTGSTPGLPTTGFGGDATQNFLLLLLSGIIAGAGGTYFWRSYYKKA